MREAMERPTRNPTTEQRACRGILMRSLLMLIAFLASAHSAAAAELGSEDNRLSLEVHGFVSPGFIVTTQNNYLAKSKQGSFEFTEVGINFTKPLTDKLRLGLQLFARDLGPVGDYSPKADWFYLDYRWKDWLGLRAGRVKLPFGLYNDTSDIDSARVPVLLPQSVYPTQNRDFLLAQTGGELYGYIDLGSGGALDYRLYGGTIFLETNPQPGSPFEVVELTTPYVVGGRLLWETPIQGLRAGGSVQTLELDTKLLFSTPIPSSVGVEIPATLWVGSIEYSAHDLLVAAEYSRWHVRVRSSDPTLFPETSVVSERAYGMVSYRLKSWFHPGIYYSMLYPNMTVRSGTAAQQHDVAATLRFDINDHWLVKFEAHYMNGTAALNRTLNDNRPLDTLARDWALLLVKTTAHF